MSVELEERERVEPAVDRDPARVPRWWWIGLALVACMFLAVSVVGARDASPAVPAPAPKATVSTFTDDFGRQCTQVQAGEAVALSCAAPPVEDRAADGVQGFLDELRSRAEEGQ